LIFRGKDELLRGFGKKYLLQNVWLNVRDPCPYLEKLWCIHQFTRKKDIHKISSNKTFSLFIAPGDQSSKQFKLLFIIFNLTRALFISFPFRNKWKWFSFTIVGKSSPSVLDFIFTFHIHAEGDEKSFLIQFCFKSAPLKNVLIRNPLGVFQDFPLTKGIPPC